MDALTEMDENADLSAATVLDRMINPDLPKVERCRFIRLTRADGGGGAFFIKENLFLKRISSHHHQCSYHNGPVNLGIFFKNTYQFWTRIKQKISKCHEKWTKFVFMFLNGKNPRFYLFMSH